MNIRVCAVRESSKDLNYLTREAARLSRMAMASLDIRERSFLRNKSRELRNKIAALKNVTLSE